MQVCYTTFQALKLLPPNSSRVEMGDRFLYFCRKMREKITRKKKLYDIAIPLCAGSMFRKRCLEAVFDVSVYMKCFTCSFISVACRVYTAGL